VIIVHVGLLMDNLNIGMSDYWLEPPIDGGIDDGIDDGLVMDDLTLLKWLIVG
jgi:hypothetical protein